MKVQVFETCANHSLDFAAAWKFELIILGTIRREMLRGSVSRTTARTVSMRSQRVSHGRKVFWNGICLDRCSLCFGCRCCRYRCSPHLNVEDGISSAPERRRRRRRSRVRSPATARERDRRKNIVVATNARRSFAHTSPAAVGEGCLVGIHIVSSIVRGGVSARRFSCVVTCYMRRAADCHSDIVFVSMRSVSVASVPPTRRL